jgi:menaquinone-9 beta-reductase
VTRPYDVVVIGAGPARGAATISVASSGRHVLLIDKAAFPRDKVSGDLLGPRSLAALGTLGCLEAVHRVQNHSIRRSAAYPGGELISVGQTPEMGDIPGYGLDIQRTVLDEIRFSRWLSGTSPRLVIGSVRASS